MAIAHNHQNPPKTASTDVVTTLQKEAPQPQSPEEKMRDLAEKRVISRTMLQVHITSFIFVNVVLYLIDLYFTPTNTWYLWPLTGWGVGLAFHTFFYSNRGSSSLKIHAVSYLIVHAYLLFIDFYPDRTLNWVIYPFLGWGAFLIWHAIAQSIFGPKKSENPDLPWMDRKIQYELNKIKMDNATTNIPSKPTMKSSSDKFCADCGTQNLGNAIFCAKCGKYF